MTKKRWILWIFGSGKSYSAFGGLGRASCTISIVPIDQKCRVLSLYPFSDRCGTSRCLPQKRSLAMYPLNQICYIETIQTKITSSFALFCVSGVNTTLDGSEMHEIFKKYSWFLDAERDFKSFCVALFLRFRWNRGRRTSWELRPPLSSVCIVHIHLFANFTIDRST